MQTLNMYLRSEYGRKLYKLALDADFVPQEPSLWYNQSENYFEAFKIVTIKVK